MTPETLPRHELIGLHVRVVESTDPTLVGCEGAVVMETMRTLTVEGASRVRQVPKAACTFEFRLPSDDAGTDAGVTSDDEGGSAEEPTYVVVEGERLVARPARRTEQRGVSKWH